MESTVLSMSLTILLFFGYEIGLNLSNGQESGAEERNPGEIITEIDSAKILHLFSIVSSGSNLI